MTSAPVSPILPPMLNWIWAAFFVVAFAAAIVQAVVFGRPDVFRDVTAALFDSAKTGFEISLGLTGIMTLWLGLMRVGEKGGVVEAIARAFRPLFARLFPGIPAGHPASGARHVQRPAITNQAAGAGENPSPVRRRKPPGATRPLRTPAP